MLRNYWEFEVALQKAIAGMQKLAEQYPGDSFLESIQRQLQHVAQWTQGGKRPQDEQIKKLSFGVMASKSVDEIDPDLAQILYRLAYFLDHWPPQN